MLCSNTWSAVINPLNQFNPGAFNINSSVTNWGRGWEFTVTANDVWVTQLGLITPNTGNFSLSLLDVATQTEVASVDNLTGGNSWNFFDIAPVELTNGSSYIVELYGIGTNAYYFSNSFTAPTGVIDYIEMQYCNGCTPGTFPTQTLSNYMYGIPDISYQIGKPSSVPTPTPLVLLCLGLIGIAISRKHQG